MVQEAANKNGIFTQRATHHQANPQQVGEPVEDDLEELETEGLVGTLEIIRPSLETFMQLPLPSTQPSIIPHLSPSQGQAPPQPSISQPPTPQIPPPGSSSDKCRQNDAKPSMHLNNFGPIHTTKPTSTDASTCAIDTNSHSCS